LCKQFFSFFFSSRLCSLAFIWTDMRCVTSRPNFVAVEQHARTMPKPEALITQVLLGLWFLPQDLKWRVIFRKC
jgi:hypothetical protein